MPKVIVKRQRKHKFPSCNFGTAYFWCCNETDLCLFLWVTENNDWTITSQTLFIRHKHNKPSVASPMMICNIQRFIPQNPSGIHYAGSHCCVRFVTERFLAPANNRKRRKSHSFALLSAGEKFWQLSCGKILIEILLLTGRINGEMFTNDLQHWEIHAYCTLKLELLWFKNMSQIVWIITQLKVLRCSNQQMQ